jgi:NAD(P)-dependent dehydrogenase (short-subunit alcohol dehydrogenase family)
VVNYSSSARDAERVVAEFASRGGTAIAVLGDVSKPADIERLFAEATKRFGRLDILVNNVVKRDLAGVGRPAPSTQREPAQKNEG